MVHLAEIIKNPGTLSWGSRILVAGSGGGSDCAILDISPGCSWELGNAPPHEAEETDKRTGEDKEKNPLCKELIYTISLYT